MSYHIVVTDRFANHLQALADYIEMDNPVRAFSWVKEIEAKVMKLDLFPEAYPLARENDAFDIELRQLVFGRGIHKYRVIFSVKKKRVVILDIRRCAQVEPPVNPEGEN